MDPKLSALRDPELLPGCRQAARHIHEAIQAGRRIVVYGDYDVDGMTGTAHSGQCLKLLGADVDYYMPQPHRRRLRPEPRGGPTLAARKAELLVTVDCGIGSVEEADTARQCGMDLIVTDHHEPGARASRALAIVHPRLPGRKYPFPD